MRSSLSRSLSIATWTQCAVSLRSPSDRHGTLGESEYVSSCSAVVKLSLATPSCLLTDAVRNFLLLPSITRKNAVPCLFVRNSFCSGLHRCPRRSRHMLPWLRQRDVQCGYIQYPFCPMRRKRAALFRSSFSVISFFLLFCRPCGNGLFYLWYGSLFMILKAR